MKTKAIEWDGKTIRKPGIYKGIPLDLYHHGEICDGPSISSSGLRKIFNESLAHYWATSPLNPDRMDEPESRAFILGRALHHLLLGQPYFATLFAIQPDEWPDEDGVVKPWHNARKVCKAWHAERKKEGRSVLTGGEVIRLKGMAARMGRHKLIKPPISILNGDIERSIFWKDKATDIWLKVRPDAIPGDSGDFVDLKTTNSVQFGDLVATIDKFGYAQQGALIRDGAKIVLGIEQATFTLAFVESESPYCPRFVSLKTEELDRGAKANRVALDQFAKALKTKFWPGPGEDHGEPEWIELSERAHKRIDDKLTILGAG